RVVKIDADPRIDSQVEIRLADAANEQADGITAARDSDGRVEAHAGSGEGDPGDVRYSAFLERPRGVGSDRDRRFLNVLPGLSGGNGDFLDCDAGIDALGN